MSRRSTPRPSKVGLRRPSQREIDPGAAAASASPSGSSSCSPDWKRKSQRRLPIQVAPASFGARLGAASMSLANACVDGQRRADEQPQIGNASASTPFSSAPLASSESSTCRSCCQTAAGWRSTTSTTSASGRRRETRASPSQGHDIGAQPVEIDQEERASGRAPAHRNGGDRRFDHPVETTHLGILSDLESPRGQQTSLISAPIIAGRPRKAWP